MGEVFRFKNTIVKIWSNDHDPAHVEVFRPSIKDYDAKAKFYIVTLECYESTGFSNRALKEIKKELEKRHEKIKSKWKEIHGEEN